MSTGSNNLTCQLGSWAMAAGAAALTVVLLMLLGGWNFWAAALIAALVFLFLGLLLSWVLCTPLAGPVEPGSAGRAPGDIELSKRAQAVVGGSADAAVDTAAGAKAAATSAAATATGAAKASAETASDAAAKAKTATTEAAEEVKETAADTASAAKAAATPDYDKDGVHEGENEGTRPAALDGPRGGKADNLKEIKGVGPKLEKLLHSMGFYHFDQIAGWTANEIAWVNANLQGFKGRVTRDNWVEQAKVLAAGGETEFSKRVEDGDVY